MKNIFFGIAIVFWFGTEVIGQSKNGDPPEIGLPCPDFTLKNVLYYSKSVVSLTDLKGKWFVLDFWSSTCGSCLELMPKMNVLQKEMTGKLQVILLGWDDPKARPLYEKLKKLKHLDLPVVYDTLLNKQFIAKGLPFQILVDDKSIVRAITYHVDKKLVDSFQSGYTPYFDLHSSVRDRHGITIQFDYTKPFMVNGNGGSGDKFLYRSVLSKWTPEIYAGRMDFYGTMRRKDFFKTGIQEIGASVKQLYKEAYMGKEFLFPGDSLYGVFWQYPILAIHDSSIFKYNGDTGTNMFCYSLIIPEEKASDKLLQKMMRQDLKNYFGFEVVLEKKMMPYWRLVATEFAKRKLKTKGKPLDFDKSMQPMDAGLDLTDLPVNGLLGGIFGIFSGYPPFLDETGIEGNIDIKLDGDLTNFQELRKALQKNGLDLLKSEKIMTVMTIKDSLDDAENDQQ